MVLVGIAVALLLGAMGVAGLFLLQLDLPEVHSWLDYAGDVPKTSRVLSADGEVLAEFWEERRTILSPDEIPEVLRDAVLASEDADFLEHEGIDAGGILRALWVDLLALRVVQGGSTITQQVAKNLFLSSERSVERKVKEAALALRLEHRLTKDEILGIYVNEIYMGHGRYGVQEAARHYFGVDARDLRVDQAATIAGLIASPERYSPRKHPRASRIRRDRVIRRLHNLGWIEDATFEAAMASPIETVEPDPMPSAEWFVDAAHREVTALLGTTEVQRGGLRIHTTLDPRWQERAQEALESGLRRADRRGGIVAALEWVEPQKRDAVRARLGRCLNDACDGIVVSHGGTPKFFEVATQQGLVRVLDTPDARHVDPENGSSLIRVGHRVRVILKPGQSTRGGSPEAVWGMGPQGAVVALDRASGEVRALVGGESALAQGFNRALHAWRSAGSVFKPIVFAAALESGRVAPESLWEDSPRSWRDGRGGRWTPQNHDRQWSGDFVTLADAMADSLNGVAVQVLSTVTTKPVHVLSRALGLKSSLPSDLTLALGSASVTPLEMAGVFSVFANEGIQHRPTMIRRVLHPTGINVWPASALPKERLSRDTARVMKDLLRAVVDRGTGEAGAIPGLELAGKTGTSSGARDSWFVGYSEQGIVAVWVGFDDNRPLPRGGGASTALPIWRRIMEDIHSGN